MSRLICIEGPDGSGKTTLSKNLLAALTEKGVEAILTREPGGTDAGTSIRELVFRTDVVHEAKLCLFYADRLQHLQTVVVPALRAGKMVISDRSELSTYSYQVHPHADEVLLQLFQHMSNQVQSVLSEFQCDTLVCHLPYEAAEQRIHDRVDTGGEYNSFDSEQELFKRAVHAGMQHGQQYLHGTYTFHAVDACKDELGMLSDAQKMLGV